MRILKILGMALAGFCLSFANALYGLSGGEEILLTDLLSVPAVCFFIAIASAISAAMGIGKKEKV